MSPNKSRLSDVAKQSATDRASKLVSGFMPPPPAPAPQSSAVIPEVKEEPAAPVPDVPTTEPVAVVKSAPTPLPTPKPERTRKTGSTLNFEELINQPLPDGVKCDKPIMLHARHHRALRQLSFTNEKPMTELLFNLLESALQPYLRDQQNDV